MLVADELSTLVAWLEFHRSTLAGKCADLDDAQLRQRAVPPSSLSLLGLVRHMTEVERGWFRRVFSAQDAPPLYCSAEDPDGDFDNVHASSTDEAFTAWRRECEAAHQVTSTITSLDDIAEGDCRGEQICARWILIHMVEEYARHNGHADLLRECVDGTVGC